MNTIMTPADVEAAAAKAGKTMMQVCREAGISHSIFSRWKAQRTEPNLSTYRRIIEVVLPQVAA